MRGTADMLIGQRFNSKPRLLARWRFSSSPLWDWWPLSDT